MVSLTAPRETVDIMWLLDAGVPLSLLVDLAYPQGPHSEEILAAERDEVFLALARI